MFIDTHCHLNMMVKKKFNILLEESHYFLIEKIIKESIDADVSYIVNVGTSVPESLNSVNIAKRFTSVFATVAIHPCDAGENWRKDFEQIRKLVEDKDANKIVGVGETGLDFYHKPFNKQRQIDCFKAHIELSLEHDLPLSIHIRDAESEVLSVLEEYAKDVKGVNHCFQGQKDVAEQFLKWGFYLGINAPITYPKNGYFRELLKEMPLDKLILETDAPFLPPQQFRGKQNHPMYIPLLARVLADCQGVSVEKVAEITTQNAKTLFGI